MRAFIFPGQGTQTVGMGKALAEAFPSAREVFEEVDEALNQRLSRLMWQGPESELMLTENTQPAVTVGEGAMSALIGIDMAGAEEAVKEAGAFGVVVIANDNAPGQIVISGATRAVEKAGEIAKTKGAKRAIALAV